MNLELQDLQSDSLKLFFFMFSFKSLHLKQMGCVHCAPAATRGSIVPLQAHHSEAPHERLQGASVHPCMGVWRSAHSAKSIQSVPSFFSFFLKIPCHHNLLHQYCVTICDSKARNQSFPSLTVLSAP